MRRLAAGLAVLAAASSALPTVALGNPVLSRRSFSASAAGAAVYADVLGGDTGSQRLATAGAGVSAASVDSDGLASPLVGETGQVIQPEGGAGTDKRTYGRGAGLTVTLAGTSLLAATGLGGPVEAAAPPSSSLRSNVGGPVAVAPLAYAGITTSQAQPLWSDHLCVMGQPTSFGLGSAADVQLLDLASSGAGKALRRPLVATDAGQGPDRSLVQSRSFTYLRPNDDGTFAVVSETRQTLAPVTLFRGSPNELTIEVLGEWALRAIATGRPGGATIEYGPAGAVGPDTPVLRLTKGGLVSELRLQQLLGGDGVRLAAAPLLSLAVGERPRARAADGQRAAAAVDVVRLRLVEPGLLGASRLLDLRLGHMEVAAAAPDGGVRCTIPVRKAGAPTFVEPGDAFTWTISIPSATAAVDGLGCDLGQVRAVDRARGSAGVTFTILSASHGGVIEGATVTWDDLGRYRVGGPPIVMTVEGRVKPDSTSGVLTDTVEVAASLEDCTGGAVGPGVIGARAARPLVGRSTLTGPTVGAFN